MKPLAALLLTGSLCAAALAHAQGSEPSAPVCTVARDPQWVTPAGELHVLDAATSSVLRWSLGTRAALASLPITPGGVASAYVSAHNSLVTARATPNRLTVRPLVDKAPEKVMAQLPTGALCGLGATDELVIACLRNDAEVSYLVYPTASPSTSPLVRVDGVGEVRVPPPPAAILPSWDSMAWDAETRTLYVVRNQVFLLGAFALRVGEDGQLGEVSPLAEPSDPNSVRANETLTLLPDGRLFAPDGLLVNTSPELAIAADGDRTGNAFAIGADVLRLGSPVTRGCALAADATELHPDARVSTGPLRTAYWRGRAYLLIGSGATATLRALRAGTGDLDGDRAGDATDVFPLEPVTRRDWDHDGVADVEDAAPTQVGDWLDSDGDKVADNADKFPDDPNESRDSDGDGVGDHEDQFPDDPTRSADADSDGADDDEDFAPYDPLEQTDQNDNGVGDNADHDPPFGEPAEAFDVQVDRRAGLLGFSPEGDRARLVLVLYDNGRFKLCEPASCLGGTPRDFLGGTFERRGRAGKRLTLRFDVATMSRLWQDFAFEASGFVPLVDPDPRGSPFFFVPRKVFSSGSATLGPKGVTFGLSLRLGYPRPKTFDPGARGGVTWRGKGAQIELP